jgi:hypothetical protein
MAVFVAILPVRPSNFLSAAKGVDMKLLDQVRQLARVKHFSYRTEQAYAYWIERYIRYHGIRHPQTMGAAEAEAFLTHLAVDGHVSASTQNQALAALLFLMKCTSWKRRRRGCPVRWMAWRGRISDN